MADRLTRWEGRDEDGARAVLVKRDGPFHDAFQEAIRKLARYEDAEEVQVSLALYDREEIHENCTVQILTNSITGAVSIGWWENGQAAAEADEKWRGGRDV